MSSIPVLKGEGKVIRLQSGNTMKFLNRNDNGRYSLIEAMVPPTIPGPPLHVHHVREEGFYVLEGTVGFQIGEQTFHGESGCYLFAPKGTVHTYWNQGRVPARLLILIAPSGYEEYFEELSAGLATVGDSREEAIRVRQELSSKYDIEVVGPARQANLARETEEESPAPTTTRELNTDGEQAHA